MRIRDCESVHPEPRDVLGFILGWLEAYAGIDREELSGSAALAELDVDSLTVADLTQAIRHEFSVGIRAREVGFYSTLEEVAAYVCSPGQGGAAHD